LDGGPRRFSVLPSEYDTLTRVSLPFVFVLAAVQVLFFWNVFQTARGKAGAASFDERGLPEPAPRRDWTVPVAEAWVMLSALAVACAFGVGGYFIGKSQGEPSTGGGGGGQTTVSGEGAEVFAASGCGSCHGDRLSDEEIRVVAAFVAGG
jgi:hypothetical protein